MSTADQARWDQRYTDGAYAQRPHPSAFLRSRFASLKVPASVAALDVACGAGRNALYLASMGCAVTAVDGSQVAIDRARASALDNMPTIDWLVADLEPGLPASLVATRFDLIVMIRYVNLSLLAALAELLNPGGYLLVEQHVRTSQNVGGPGRAAFRVAPGALRKTVAGLQCIVQEEGLVTDPDGKPMALSRLLARRLP